MEDCPHRIPKGTARSARGDAVELIWCAWVNSQLGWRHGLPASICNACAGAPAECPAMLAVRKGARINRVLTDTPRFAETWKGCASAQSALAALRDQDGMTLAEIEEHVFAPAVHPTARDKGRPAMAAAHAAELAKSIGLVE